MLSIEQKQCRLSLSVHPETEIAAITQNFKDGYFVFPTDYCQRVLAICYYRNIYIAIMTTDHL